MARQRRGGQSRGKPFICWPDILAQYFNRTPAKADFSFIAPDKELAQIDLVGGFAKQRVGYGLVIVAKQNRAILLCKPIAHTASKIGQGHSVSMPLIADELIIPFGEAIQILF